MSLHRAGCCCPPVSGPSCAVFQSDCFNTDNEALFPAQVRVRGSSQSEKFVYHFHQPEQTFCSPEFIHCPLFEVQRTLASWDITLSRVPDGPPGTVGGCQWAGVPNPRACWAGIGGTVKVEITGRTYQLCDYANCGCSVDPNDPCSSANLLYADSIERWTGKLKASLGCGIAYYCDAQQFLFGHGVTLNALVDKVIQRRIYEPFCSFCSVPPPPCETTEIIKAPPDTADGDPIGVGICRGCQGSIHPGRVNCNPPPGECLYGAGGIGCRLGEPYGIFIGDAVVGGERLNDACGRLRLRSFAECSIEFL